MKTVSLRLRSEVWAVRTWEDVQDIADLGSPTLIHQLIAHTRPVDSVDAQAGDWLLHLTYNRSGKPNLQIVEYVGARGLRSALVRVIERRDGVMAVSPHLSMVREHTLRRFEPAVAQQLGFSRELL